MVLLLLLHLEQSKTKSCLFIFLTAWLKVLNLKLCSTFNGNIFRLLKTMEEKIHQDFMLLEGINFARGRKKVHGCVCLRVSC